MAAGGKHVRLEASSLLGGKAKVSPSTYHEQPAKSRKAEAAQAAASKERQRAAQEQHQLFTSQL